MRPPRRLVAGGEDTEVGTTRVRHRDGVVRVAAVRSARACGVCTAARGRPAVIPAPAAILQRLRERELGTVRGPAGPEPGNVMFVPSGDHAGLPTNPTSWVSRTAPEPLAPIT